MSSLTGTPTLVRLALRRDRVRLPVWVLSFGLMMVYATNAMAALYPTAHDRQLRAMLMSNPAAVMMSGPGYGTDDYTLGAMIANELALTLVVASSIMSILLVVRHSRGEEESGRAELLRAGATGAYAPLTAALVVAVVANVGVGSVQLAAMIAAGLAPVDSAVLALAMALVSLVFAGLTAVCVQVAASARSATGAGLALLAAAFAIRAVGDVRSQGGSTLSWFSPIAWMHQLRPFVELRWWPLLLMAGLALAGVTVAYALLRRRDLGAGFLPARAGRRTAPAGLSSPLGLMWRLQRGTCCAWAVALGLMFAASGSLVQTVADSIAEMPPNVVRLLALDDDDLVSGYTAVLVTFAGLAVGAYAVSSVLRLRGEEQSGRTEQALSAPVSRRRWLASALGITALAATGLLTLAGAALGLTAALATGRWGWLPRLTGASLAVLPAVLVLVGLAAALYGLRSSAAVLAWAVVAYTVGVGLFGGLFDLPGWVLDLSPFHVLPRLPAEPVSWAALLGLTGVGLVLALVGDRLFRRRDLTAG